MAGARYAVSNRWSVTGELRYFDAGSPDLSGSRGELSADYQTLDLIVGVSFGF